MQGGRKREGWERNSRLEAAPGGGSVNHSPLSRYVTNSTSAISVTWPDKISLRGQEKRKHRYLFRGGVNLSFLK